MRKKATDQQLWHALNASSGVYTIASGLLKTVYNIELDATSIRKRAIRHPKLLDEIKQITINQAENGLYVLMQSKNEHIRLKAIMFHLKTIGKDHGYTERKELEVEGDLQLSVKFVDAPMPATKTNKKQS